MNTDVASNIKAISKTLQNGVTLVAVSKYHHEEKIMTAYNEGQRVFGESHVQELTRKHDSLPKDIEWHFIGHLQTNKVKYIAPYISMIDAVDTIKLMREINKQAARHDRVIDILLELHIAEEETKYGFTPEACKAMLEDGEWRALNNIRICGLMMMASNTDDKNQIKSEFNTAAALFDEIKSTYFPNDDYFCVRSWGMSHDYTIAMDCKSTMVRVGTAIFGEREY